jgi:hypothetical protein
LLANNCFIASWHAGTTEKDCMPGATTRDINGEESDDGVDLTFSKLEGMQDFQESCLVAIS